MTPDPDDTADYDGPADLPAHDAPQLGAVKLGRVAPKAKKAALLLGNYLPADVRLPDKVDYYTAATPALKRVYLNDRYGDCVIAGKLHQIAVWNAADGGEPVQATDQEVLSQYQKLKAGPGDSGCVVTDVLDHFRQHGLTCGGKTYTIDGYVGVRPANHDAVKAAVFAFGSLTFGLDIPADWVRNARPGAVWRPSNAPSVGGHDVCFTGDTKVPLLDGSEHTLKDLAGGSAGDRFWVYSCDDSGKVVPGMAHSPRKTGEGWDLVRVTLDNGESVRCTPDHRFMLRDGSYREAAKLQPGDSLMPLYRDTGEKRLKGYERVYMPSTREWVYTHRMVAAFAAGGRNKGTVHHKDFDKRNNAPDNLEVMTWAEHTRLHSQFTALLNAYAKSPEGRAKSREVIGRLWVNPAWRAEMTAQLGLNGRTACNRRAAAGVNGTQAWTPEQRLAAARKAGKTRTGKPLTAEHIANTTAGLRRLYATDPDALARCRERQAKATAASAKKQRAGITEAQRAARSRNAAVGLAARLAKIAASKAAAANNHKVVSVEPAGREDVYDLTVDKFHNFALSAGVFVHNCAVGFDQVGVQVSTWGTVLTIAWEAVHPRWVNELYCQLAPAWYGADGKAAACGIDVAALRADLQIIGQGGVPTFSDPPAPPPGPQTDTHWLI